MRDEDGSAVSAPRGFSKECVARFTRRSFDRHLLFLRERADVCRTEFKFNPAGRCKASASLARLPAWQAARLRPVTARQERLPGTFLVVALDQSFYKLRIGVARSSAQMMIQVANDQSFVTEAD